MRKEILDNSVLLKKDDWVQLRKIVAPEKKINGYTYSHEIRCNGDIVAFIPFKGPFHEYLLRNEAVPCWELDKPFLCCFTGGVDSGSTPYKTCIKELKEEAGYIIDKAEENRVIKLGTCFGIKSSDTVYHLFAIDVTNFPKEKTTDLFVETELEKSSTNKWMDKREIMKNVQEPFSIMIIERLLNR